MYNVGIRTPSTIVIIYYSVHSMKRPGRCIHVYNSLNAEPMLAIIETLAGSCVYHDDKACEAVRAVRQDRTGGWMAWHASNSTYYIFFFWKVILYLNNSCLPNKVWTRHRLLFCHRTGGWPHVRTFLEINTHVRAQLVRFSLRDKTCLLDLSLN